MSEVPLYNSQLLALSAVPWPFQESPVQWGVPLRNVDSLVPNCLVPNYQTVQYQTNGAAWTMPTVVEVMKLPRGQRQAVDAI